MPKTQVTALEFIAEANRILAGDPAGMPGLKFLPFKERAVELGLTGYQYDGDWDPAYQRAWDDAGKTFEIKPTQAT